VKNSVSILLVLVSSLTCLPLYAETAEQEIAVMGYAFNMEEAAIFVAQSHAYKLTANMCKEQGLVLKVKQQNAISFNIEQAEEKDGLHSIRLNANYKCS